MTLLEDDFSGFCVVDHLVNFEHDWTVGHAAPMGLETRIDYSSAVDWPRRFLRCRDCEGVLENDGSRQFARFWAHVLVKVESEE